MARNTAIHAPSIAVIIAINRYGRLGMARFVRLTQDNSTDIYHVNIDHIVSFYRLANMSYTVVVVTNEKNMTVKEHPDEIHVMAGS